MKLVGGIIAMGFGALFYALTLKLLWGWFVVPMGILDIGYAHAYGLSILVRTIVTDLTIKRDDHALWAIIVAGMVWNFGIIMMGAIANTIMLLP